MESKKRAVYRATFRNEQGAETETECFAYSLFLLNCERLRDIGFWCPGGKVTATEYDIYPEQCPQHLPRVRIGARRE